MWACAHNDRASVAEKGGTGKRGGVPLLRHGKHGLVVEKGNIADRLHEVQLTRQLSRHPVEEADVALSPADEHVSAKEGAGGHEGVRDGTQKPRGAGGLQPSPSGGRVAQCVRPKLV